MHAEKEAGTGSALKNTLPAADFQDFRRGRLGPAAQAGGAQSLSGPVIPH